MKTWLCLRVPEKYWEYFTAALVGEKEYPEMIVGTVQILGCETSRDGQKKFIYGKPKFMSEDPDES